MSTKLNINNFTIISGGQTGADIGGQTGADIGALIAAKQLGISTGGIAPKGWQTEEGSKKDLLESFGLEECELEGYLARTLMNVLLGDLTIIVSTNMDSAGTKQTMELCRENFRVFRFFNPDIESAASDLAHYLSKRGRETSLINNKLALNFAGNRESVSPGIQDKTELLIKKAFTLEINNEEKQTSVLF